ncbi:hypothetical protein H5410_052309 [Solanum commersonii]|uniref:RING-type E3 ubiquitin transferase n=1 Tax=Solanum commersonii TaxID=4109 RepID=A0A9J5X127_SOLCO|nr:hypothetical protein H5410_052309 [Solanum commersonii]
MMNMNSGHSDRALFLTDGQYIDGVFVIDDAASLFRTNRRLSQPHNHRSNNYRNSSHSSRNIFGNHLAPHNNYSAFWDPYTYHQFIDQAYVTTDDVNQLIVAMQNLDHNFGSRLSGQPFDYRALLDLPGVGHHQEEIVMMKKRSHCVNKVDSEEICSICLSEYVNDETIGFKNYFGNHNNYSRRSDEMNDIIVTMRSRESNFGSRVRGQQFDYRALKKRSHCGNKIEEICSICLSEYVNGDTIGTLHCRRESRATCIEEWVQRGKKNCPICRSSVLPRTQS